MNKGPENPTSEGAVSVNASASNFVIDPESNLRSTAKTIVPFIECFAIDPESNLRSTAKTIVPFIECLVNRNGWKWNGVIGEQPTKKFIEKVLTPEGSLFIYCGHGCRCRIALQPSPSRLFAT